MSSSLINGLGRINSIPRSRWPNWLIPIGDDAYTIDVSSDSRIIVHVDISGISVSAGDTDVPDSMIRPELRLRINQFVQDRIKEIDLLCITYWNKMNDTVLNTMNSDKWRCTTKGCGDTTE